MGSEYADAPAATEPAPSTDTSTTNQTSSPGVTDTSTPALTGDLAGFWKAGWLDARKDMRGRYPKHNWPETPATATR